MCLALLEASMVQTKTYQIEAALERYGEHHTVSWMSRKGENTFSCNVVRKILIPSLPSLLKSALHKSRIQNCWHIIPIIDISSSENFTFNSIVLYESWPTKPPEIIWINPIANQQIPDPFTVISMVLSHHIYQFFYTENYLTKIILVSIEYHQVFY